MCIILITRKASVCDISLYVGNLTPHLCHEGAPIPLTSCISSAKLLNKSLFTKYFIKNFQFFFIEVTDS